MILRAECCTERWFARGPARCVGWQPKRAAGARIGQAEGWAAGIGAASLSSSQGIGYRHKELRI